MDKYTEYGFAKGDLYIVDYKLLNKCSITVWKQLLNRENSNIKAVSLSDSESEDIYSEEELEFIHKNKEEFI